MYHVSDHRAIKKNVHIYKKEEGGCGVRWAG